MEKLRDLNYSYLAFGKNLKEFNGFLGNFKNIGEDVWIDSDDGRLLGNFELDNPKYNEVIFKEGQAFLIITFLTESFCQGDLEIIIGYSEKYYTHDGYFHRWYYDNDTKLWDQRYSEYYSDPELIDLLNNDSNPLLIISIDMKDANNLSNYIQQEIKRLGEISVGEKLFNWKY